MPIRVAVADEEPPIRRPATHYRFHDRLDHVAHELIDQRRTGIELGVEPLRAGGKTAGDHESTGTRGHDWLPRPRHRVVVIAGLRVSNERHDDLVREAAFGASCPELVSAGKELDQDSV